MNLENMTRAELEALKRKVEAAIEDARIRDREKAREAAAKAAAEFGYSLEELNGKPAGRKKAAARSTGTPRYRNPADPSQTWTGKGRQPAWFKEAMEAGTDPSKLEI